MSMATAAEYGLMLTAPGPPPGPAAPETGRLSARERELVTLVAQGRTDAQIAAQLYISIRTVRSHLDRIPDKTGARRRADLTRLALREAWFKSTGALVPNFHSRSFVRRMAVMRSKRHRTDDPILRILASPAVTVKAGLTKSGCIQIPPWSSRIDSRLIET
jgi:DNA-binding CsgD family transcriptional regulator